MQTAGAEKTSELVLEGFTTMNQRWMKRRIERSRARCESAERTESSRIDTHETGSQLAKGFARVAEKQSSKLRPQAKVEQ